MENTGRLTYSPHPLLPAAGRQIVDIPPAPGETLAEYLDRVLPQARHQPMLVCVNGRWVPREQWPHVRLDGALVSARAGLHGGGGEEGGSDPARTLLTLAVLAFAPYLSTQLAISQSLVAVGGMLLVNALVPLRQPDYSSAAGSDPSPTYSISGGRNRARRGQSLPLVVGTHRLMLDLAATPHTEFEGEDHVLYQLFNAGLADMRMSDFRIGDSLVASQIGEIDGVFEDVAIVSQRAVAWDHWPRNVDSLAVGAELSNAAGWIQRTGSVDAYALAVDIIGALYYQGDNGPLSLSVDFEIEYRKVGDTTWLPFIQQDNSWGGSGVVDPHYWSAGLFGAPGLSGWVQVAYDVSEFELHTEGDEYFPGTLWRWRPIAEAVAAGDPHPPYVAETNAVHKANADTRPVRITLRRTVPSGDQWEVRVRRVSADPTDERAVSEFSWSTLRTYQPDTADYTGQTPLALRIRASSQLSGVVDTFNALVESRARVVRTVVTGDLVDLPDYTSNPAWIFLHLARGAAKVARNLLENGDASAGNNRNFSALTYVDDILQDYLRKTDAAAPGALVLGDVYLPVWRDHAYRIQADLRTGLAGNRVLAGIACYSADKLLIQYWMCWRDPDKDTTLHADYTAGSLTMDIVPAGEAWFDAGVSPFSYVQMAVQPNGLDQPNFDSVRIASIDTGPGTFWRLTLQSPLATSFPAGTAVGNSRSGSTFTYALVANVAPGTSFKAYSNTINGMNAYDTPPTAVQMRRGTAFVRFMLQGAQDFADTTDVRGLSIQYAGPGPIPASVGTGPSRLYGAGLPDTRLDLAAIYAWAAWCDSEDLRCDAVFDRTGMGVGEMLRIVAQCGRAAPTWSSGKLGVVWDEADKPPVAVFGLFNMRAGSFRVEYNTQAPVAEIEASFINAADNYRPDSLRVTVPGARADGRVARLELFGVTRESQASEEANLLAARQAYHRRRITWETDIEGLVVDRGDVVQLSHDLTQWGYSGRLVAGTTTVLTLPRLVPFTPGETHYLLLREPDGSFATHELQDWSGDTDQLTLLTPLAEAPDDGRPVDWAWFMAPLPTPGKRVRIVDIDPVSQYHVRITAIDEDPAYYASKSGGHVRPTPPAYIGQAAQIASLVVAENLLTRAGLTRVTIRADLVNAQGFRLRVGVNGGPLVDYGPINGTEHSLDLQTGDVLDIRARPWALAQLAGTEPAETTLSHTVLGKTAPPADVTGFAFVVDGYNLRLSLNPNPEIDIDYYEIRQGADYATGSFYGRIPDGAVELVRPKPAVGAYDLHVKAVDLDGNESATEATVSVTIAAPPAPPAFAAAVNGGDRIRLSWTRSAGSFPLASWEVRKGGANWDAATPVTVTDAAEAFDTTLPTANTTYRVRATDIHGNLGAVSTLVFNVTVAPAPTITAERNSRSAYVTLSWNRSPGTYPIAYWELRRGSDGDPVESATDLGDLDVSTATREESDGLWTYWVRAVDVAGQAGAWGSTSIAVAWVDRFVWQSAEPFTPHDITGGDGWGTACAVARNGQIAVATTANNYVLTMLANGGLLSAAKLSPISGVPSSFGGSFDSVDMTPSGDRLVVGDPGANKVHIYRWQEGDWVAEQEISNALSGSNWGAGVAINGNGSVIAVWGDINTRVYTRSGTTWTLSDTLGSAVTLPAVELSDDGNVLILFSAFTVRLYYATAPGAFPAAAMQTFVTFGAGNSQAGISADGAVLALNADGSGSFSAFCIWEADAVPPTSYTKVFEDAPGRFVLSARMNPAGTLALGVLADGLDIYVVLFRKGADGVWFKAREDLLTTLTGSVGGFGAAAALSAEGSVVLVGDPDNDRLWPLLSQPMQS